MAVFITHTHMQSYLCEGAVTVTFPILSISPPVYWVRFWERETLRHPAPRLSCPSRGAGLGKQGSGGGVFPGLRLLCTPFPTRAPHSPLLPSRVPLIIPPILLRSHASGGCGQDPPGPGPSTGGHLVPGAIPVLCIGLDRLGPLVLVWKPRPHPTEFGISPG